MVDNIIIYKGLIIEGDLDDNFHCLFIGGIPIVKSMDDIMDKHVTLSYYISDIEMNEQELLENTIKSLSGSMDSEYYASYSDCTGYLWTNEKMQVGGHDLLSELQDNIGKYIYMKIIVH